MPLPIVEQITLDLISTLQAITSAGGYGVTLDVQRSRRQGNTPVTDRVTCVVKEEDPTDDPDASQDQRWIHQPYSLWLTTFESDDSEFPARQSLQVAAAWIKKVLRVDKLRSGLAMNTEIGNEVWVDDGADHGAVDQLVLPIDIFYQTLLDDPFSQA